MTEKAVQVTIVNHVTIDIDAAPEAVWANIQKTFIETGVWEKAGYAIEKLEDEEAFLGGYRMRMEKDGELVDDRIIRFTEIDHQAHRLSIFADYLSTPDGLNVFVTYHAHDRDGGSRYTIDCHTRMGMQMPASGDKAELARTIAETKESFDTHLNGALARVKAQLEGEAGGASNSGSEPEGA